ncbi:hypothetical protein HanXRQr2_Chr16g0744531 [Helianthus annuus]|uniref:Uncharacterized protein n=1 Tax=Helianthus annuus TaxID=4232 RepID=A0A9K3DQC9_HELAN|nr:hypothetical protein HanXRQr2_Chr16g0744531 [Helianthus annuus]
MSRNQKGSLIQTIQIEYTNLIRLCMGYIKLPGRGTRHCLHICSRMVLKEVRLTVHCSLRERRNIFCWYRYT